MTGTIRTEPAPTMFAGRFDHPLEAQEWLLSRVLHGIDERAFGHEMKRVDGMLFESTASDLLDGELEACLAMEL